jgi:hypothetical protein
MEQAQCHGEMPQTLRDAAIVCLDFRRLRIWCSSGGLDFSQTAVGLLVVAFLDMGIRLLQ